MKLFLFGAVFFFLSPLAHAASLYLDPGMVTINRGDSLTVAVRIDVDEAVGECINAADVVVTYDESIQPVDISLGDSIFSLWIEAPTIDTENRTITFAGGIPNGYCGRIEGDPRLTNVLAKIIFRSPGLQIGGGSDVNAATVSLTEASRVYLNDGQGTLANLRLFPSNITLERSAGAQLNDEWRTRVQSDRTPPQEFAITLERDEKAFGGRYFIVFNTSDKETGLSHYEVMEEPLSELGMFSWGRADAPWVIARSPYVVKDQSLNSTIRVRAIDKAGNEYLATLVPDNALRTSENLPMLQIILGVSIGVLVLVLGGMGFYVHRRRKRAALTTQNINVADIEQ